MYNYAISGIVLRKKHPLWVKTYHAMQKEMPRQTAREKKSRPKMWKTILPNKKWARPSKVWKKASIFEKECTPQVWNQVNFVSKLW
jgi:hypothetical protein